MAGYAGFEPANGSVKDYCLDLLANTQYGLANSPHSHWLRYLNLKIHTPERKLTSRNVSKRLLKQKSDTLLQRDLHNFCNFGIGSRYGN